MSIDTLGLTYGPLYGAVFFASIMTSAFYGIMSMQTFSYYVHYPNDPLRIKCFVAILWVLDTLNEGLVLSGSYKLIMGGLLNPLSILVGLPEFVFQLLSTALAAVPTQFYFVYRIYIFSGKNIIPLLVWCPLGIYQLVGSIIYISKALYIADSGIHVIEVTLFDDKFFSAISTSTLSVAAAVDILIAISLTYLLLRKRTATNFTSTAHILLRLIVFSVNTGSWTALFALLVVILMHCYPMNLIYVVFAIPLCSVYCNTLLANLNARTYIRGERTTHNLDSEHAMGSGASQVLIISSERKKEHLSGRPATMAFSGAIHSVTSEVA